VNLHKKTGISSGAPEGLASSLIPNMNLNYKPNVLKKSYQWEHISKEKLFNVLQEVNTVEKIVHYENSDFEKNKVGVENAEQELGKIFESLAQQ
jgi:hypothetical protein